MQDPPSAPGSGPTRRSGRVEPPDRPDGAAGPVDDGPVLPDVTSDERHLGWGDPPEPDDDERYLREVPPHHGV